MVGRVVGGKMGEGMGQPVVIDNRGGASGVIGTQELAKSNPDGYTMLFHIVTTAAINPHIYKKVQFDWVKDFQPLARIAIVPNVLLINKDVPAKNVKELIALAKANPGKLTYASSGNASLLHLPARCSHSRPASTSCTCLTKARRPRCRTSWQARSR